MIELVPIRLDEARRFIDLHHRHSDPPTGWIVGTGLAVDGQIVGVAVLGRPVSPKVQVAEPRTVEITRVATLGDDVAKNANSRLYGAACRAAAALGYLDAITYTLPEESGASLRAAGFVLERDDAGARPGQTWSSPSRPRYEENLFGERVIPDGPKRRWRRALVARRVAA